jgi:mono/diheme cytochrome c family protein
MSMAWLSRLAFCLATWIPLVPFAGEPRAAEPNFTRDIQPLLARRCFSCHGPDTQEAGLRLDEAAAATTELDGGATAIVPGDPAASELMVRITTTDPDLRMPPEGKPLSADEIAAVTAWIASGADWPAHWAFRPPVRPAVPTAAAGTNPIDAFVDAERTARGLPKPRLADKPILLRRVTYGLTGLPPSEQEMADFLADDSADAWETVVDRLLASPHYGEHQARHWLDLVRFAETNSFERDGVKPHAWRYRDYVIRSFNADTPYDQFVIEQLAGDELSDPSADALIATGFYRLGLWDDEPADKLQARYDTLDDIVSTTGQVFLGLTINCARCHDHKIDPLTQRDYYGMLAFFQNLTPMGDRQMNPAFIERVIPADEGSVAAAEHAAQELGRRRAEAEANLAAIRTRIAEHGKQALDDLARKDLAAWKQALKDLEAERASLPLALVVTEHGPEAPETFVLPRGNPRAEPKPELRVAPGFPEVLAPPTPTIAPAPNGRSSGRRTALAAWIASPDNPLTSRVMANRIWQQLFGRGIVRSTSNFGLMGDPPTHPELLDWLATELVANDWRRKPLIKSIVMSRAYRAGSTANPEALDQDPLNDGLWRFDPRRLTAEELRDSIHVASGRFNPLMFGPGVYPALPAEVLATQSVPGAGWGNSSPEDQARRSIYIHAKRTLPVPILADYDVADPDTSCPVRFVTTQPTQALGMMNGDFLHAQAREFAARVRREAGGTNADQTAAMVRRAIEVAFVRPASETEVRRGMALIDSLETTDGVDPGRALELYCLMVLNLNEFVYLD